MYYIVYENELAHHGVKGMKWGVRKQHKMQYKYAKRLSDTLVNPTDERTFNKLKKIDTKYRKKYGQDSVEMKVISLKGKKAVGMMFKDSDVGTLVTSDMIMNLNKDLYKEL